MEQPPEQANEVERAEAHIETVVDNIEEYGNMPLFDKVLHLDKYLHDKKELEKAIQEAKIARSRQDTRDVG